MLSVGQAKKVAAIARELAKGHTTCKPYQTKISYEHQCYVVLHGNGQITVTGQRVEHHPTLFHFESRYKI